MDSACVSRGSFFRPSTLCGSGSPCGSGFSRTLCALQTHEIYRSFTQDIQTDWAQIVASYVSLFLAGSILWRTAYYLTQALATESASGKAGESITLRWLPRLIGTAPIVACGFGILHVQQGLLYAAVHAGNVLEALGGDPRIEELQTLRTELEAKL